MMKRSHRNINVDADDRGKVKYSRKHKVDSESEDSQPSNGKENKPKRGKETKENDKAHVGTAKKHSKRMTKTAVKFVEDDQYVDMVAEGEESEFLSKGESQDLVNGDENCSSDEDEIIFNSQELGKSSQSNNNATVSQLKDTLEEGKWSQEQGSEESRSAEPRPGTLKDFNENAEKLIDEKINASFSKVQDFFEQKFADLMKVMELEKQLNENRQKLEVLKAKGKECEVIGNNESEVTIYKNAVDKKRGSSSSEDDLGDTSNELNEIDMQAISNISFVERELEKD